MILQQTQFVKVYNSLLELGKGFIELKYRELKYREVKTETETEDLFLSL